MSTPYLGSKISLISRLDIRYEGILYTVDSNESTIALAKVRSFGTENRPTQQPVKPRAEVYEYIIFKASDIKDLVVCEGPKETEAEPGDVDYDPAIVSVGSTKREARSNTQSSEPATKSTQSVSQPKQNAPVYKQSQQQSSQPPSYHQKQQNWQPRSQQNRQPQQSRSFNSQQGGYNNPRPTNSRPFNRAAAPKEKLKFDNDYNFEEANQEFQDKLDVVTDELDKVAFDADEKSSDNENEDKEGGESCYDKKSSFFDSISCEAIEKAEGKNTRPDWRKERQTNTETFGQNAVRSHAYYYRNRFNNQNRFQGNRPQGGDQRFHHRPNQNNNGGSTGFKPRYNNRDQQTPRQNRAF